jgi:hypothetical protein
MGNKNEGISKNVKIGIAVIFITAIIVIGGVVVLQSPIITPGTTVTFLFQDQWTEADLNGTASIYGADITDLTVDEIGELDSTDFTLLGVNYSGEGFTPVATYKYVAVVTLAGYCTQEFLISSTGTYTVIMLPKATNASVLAFSATLATDITSNTTETEWTLAVQALNSTGGANNSLGFSPYCDFISGGVTLADFGTYNKQFLIEIALSVTADTAYLTSVGGISRSITAVGNSLFVNVNQDIIGRREISVNFAAGIGTTFNITAVTVGFGSSALYTPLGAL